MAVSPRCPSRARGSQVGGRGWTGARVGLWDSGHGEDGAGAPWGCGSLDVPATPPASRSASPAQPGMRSPAALGLQHGR